MSTHSGITPDWYTSFVAGGFGKTLAQQTGLPRPAILRRYQPQEPLLGNSKVLVIGNTAGADAFATKLLEWDLDVRRYTENSKSSGQKFGAIMLVLDELSSPGELSEPIRELGAALRSLAPQGRVVTISRPVAAGDKPAVAAARQGVDGILRSVAKELRSGSTGNGILLADGVTPDSPGALGALRFLLSGRSAFVDGQFITVSSAQAQLPINWATPLSGRVAVVTGAARGIGAAIARTLARDGATVIGVDVPAAGEALADVVNEIGGTALQLDITAEDAGQRILAHAVERWGRLDIVVHNAGITRDKLLANMDAGRWDSVLAVNLESQLRMNEVFLASKAFREQPRIVSVASTSGIAGNRGQSNYAASKAGVIGLVEATAPAMAELGGTINAVAPGFIETEMTAKIPFATREAARRLNSLLQGGQPQDVAETIAFLASSSAAGINGDVIRVCGQNLVGQ